MFCVTMSDDLIDTSREGSFGLIHIEEWENMVFQGGDTLQLLSAARPREIPTKAILRGPKVHREEMLKCQTDAQNKESTIKSLCQESPRDTISQMLLNLSTKLKEAVLLNARVLMREGEDLAQRERCGRATTEPAFATLPNPKVVC